MEMDDTGSSGNKRLLEKFKFIGLRAQRSLLNNINELYSS